MSALRQSAGDDRVVDVVLADPPGPDCEQEVHLLTGFPVQHRWLRGVQGLPCFDRPAQQRVDGLGERGAGLVGRDIEQTDR